MNKVIADDAFDTQVRAFAERLASSPPMALATGKRILRAHLDGGIRAADKTVDDIAPPLFATEAMKASVAALLEHGRREFRNKVVFSRALAYRPIAWDSVICPSQVSRDRKPSA